MGYVSLQKRATYHDTLWMEYVSLPYIDTVLKQEVSVVASSSTAGFAQGGGTEEAPPPGQANSAEETKKKKKAKKDNAARRKTASEHETEPSDEKPCSLTFDPDSGMKSGPEQTLSEAYTAAETALAHFYLGEIKQTDLASVDVESFITSFERGAQRSHELVDPEPLLRSAMVVPD